MNEAEIFEWLAATGLGQIMRNEGWAWPLFETLHFIGLCTLFGALIVVDLRVIGLGKEHVSISSVMPFVPVALFGFALNLITGIGFFCGYPDNYWSNWAFKLKMALILIGGINALAFEFLERRRLCALAPGADAGVQGKMVAGTSLLLWIGVIILGRILPYTGGVG